jgi:hypothetical protein
MRVINNGPKHRLEVFDSLWEFVERASGVPEERKGASDKPELGGWSKTESLADACELAKMGYRDIRPKVDSIMDIMEERLADRFGNRFVTEYRVSGSSVDMGKFVTGEPECMIDWQEEPAASMGRVVKIVVAGSASHTIDPDWIVKRGTAVVALIDTLHKLGVGVELWWDSTINGTERSGEHTTAVRLHSSAEPMDVDDIMFALAHPSMLRRLTFAVQERSDTWKQQEAMRHKGYGTPSKLGISRTEHFDVKVEKLQDGSGDIVRDPLAWVIGTVEGLGF